ncbi:radical SAM protein [Candidatus Nomurabacteria bacterium]|nr:radical SAM protein [Candidatus Nomurabacteria bacterium]
MKEGNILTDPRNSFKGWYSTPNEIEYAVQNKQMLNPMLDLTNACNLNCPYCYIEEKNSTRKKRRPNELSVEETLNVIEVFHSLGAKTIDIVGAGEPTIDPHFKEIVNYIYNLGMTTSLFTNGIKISKEPEFVDFLFENDVTVILKLNSFHPAVQDVVAGKKGYTIDMLRALGLLIEKGFNKVIPTRLAVDTIAFKGNFKELPLIHRYCRENNIYPLTADFIPTGRTEAGMFVADVALAGMTELDKELALLLLQPLDSFERFQLRKQLREIDFEFGIEQSSCPAYYGGGICTQQIGMYVDIEGNIWPCVARGMMKKGKMMNGLFGNIRKGDNIEDVWNTHSYFREIRKHFNGSCPYKSSLT